MTTTTRNTPSELFPVEDTATSAWLALALRNDRERVSDGPTAAAIDRIRARVFDAAESGKHSKIAA